MSKTTQIVEVNKFNAGLITDASPLTTTDNSSLDEDNMVLNIDGSRNRRLGMDYEDDYSIIPTTIVNDGTQFAVASYKWKNAGGDPTKVIQVIQVGNQLKFFHSDVGALSGGLFWTYDFSSPRSVVFSFATVDGILVVATGQKEIHYLTFVSPNTITGTVRRLLIRDLFGVEDIYFGVDVTRGTDVQNRPPGVTDAHIYNLRNQSFGIPRYGQYDELKKDPAAYFKSIGGVYPANSDTVIEAFYADTQDAGDRTVERFFASDLFNNPLGTTRAAQGYFIIDAIDRGASRVSEYNKNMVRYPELSIGLSTLPADSSLSGATTVAEFAGRVWYGGFSGEVSGSDSSSPKLSSYVMFSKVVDNILDANLCYQEGDPTSKTSPDIVDTDGGFIRINEAYDIKALINIGSALIVVAANGVWRIVGGSDTGFTATNYIVEKVSDRGCTSPSSIVQLDNTVMFWSDDAIYHVAPDQGGGLTCNNISFGRIQRFYDALSISNKRIAVGTYDSYERKVRWIFNNNLNENVDSRELILDLQLQAFYLNTIKTPAGGLPRVVMSYTGLPYVASTDVVEVLVGTDPVLSGTDPVVISTPIIGNVQQKEIGYVVITSNSSVVSYTFARYLDSGFRDWRTFDGVGVDAEAYMVTSYMSGTDFQRNKGVNYITIHLRRTETGYDTEMNPINPSSCLVQARWGWATGDNSGKWGREFQAYRYRITHFPLNEGDDYDTGFSVISTRNKLRGTGKVLSLSFRSEPDKDLHLYGWSMILTVEDNL